MSNSQSQINIAIHGCTGRMGRRLCHLICKNNALKLVGAMGHPQDPMLNKPLHEVDNAIPNTTALVVTFPDLANLKEKPNVIIDFSSPDGTINLIQQARDQGIPVVIGTTGLTSDQKKIVEDISHHIPIIHAMNFSLGVNLLARITREVAKALGDDFDVEITEAHHNQKVDAPSGTALALADAVCTGLQRGPEDLICGREGQVGQRTKKEIGMHSIRLGSIVGDHTVMFGSEYERIELTHRAQSRDVFAAGAIYAAQWLIGKPAARYSMEDVLFNDRK